MKQPSFRSNKEPKTFNMKCISDPREITKVENFLQKVNKVAKLDDGTFYRLLVASTEAVNNAIIHGNKMDPRKRVCVTCTLADSDLLTVRVEDEGEGFDLKKIPNPLDENNLLKTSGRGIFLMGELMDDVKFLKGGAVVEMEIDLKRLK